jgi:glucosamine kinase
MVGRLRNFGAPRVSLFGGIAAPLLGWLSTDLRETISPAEHDAVAGALLLARREAICAQTREAAAADYARA